MCDLLPKEFEKTTEVLPFTKYGLSSFEEFRKAEKDLHRLECLKKGGLTGDEIKLYLDNEAENLDDCKKIDPDVLERKLKVIYNKVSKLESEKSICEDIEPSTSKKDNVRQSQTELAAYPEGHPINRIRDLEQSLFGHLTSDIPHITKRRKSLRRLERKKKRVLSGPQQIAPVQNYNTVNRPGSLWDLKEPPPRASIGPRGHTEKFIGPKKRTMYTIKNNCIVKISTDEEQRQNEQNSKSDVCLSEIELGEPLLEGTKMSLDDIRKMENYKDYEPGIPSKVVHLTNIASTVTLAQLELLFQQYVCENGGPPHIQLLNGNLRGQAYVSFENYDVAISAVHEINGTIVNGYPIVAKFAPSTD